jgi:hypothetical protein
VGVGVDFGVGVIVGVSKVKGRLDADNKADEGQKANGCVCRVKGLVRVSSDHEEV